MSARIGIAVDVASALAMTLLASLSNGALVLYGDTSGAPATADEDIPADAVELARFDLAESPGTVVGGVATFATLPAVPANYNGRIGWARAEDVDGLGVLVLNVGTDDEALIVSTLDVVAGVPITVADWTFAIPLLSES